MKPKKEVKVKEPIRLRWKLLKNGNLSAYLDKYENGVREYEFLKIYIVPERTPLDKAQNENAKMAAIKVKSERITELQSGRVGLVSSKAKRLHLVEWTRMVEVQKRNNGKKYGSLFNSLANVLERTKNDVYLSEVDKRRCNKIVADIRNGKSVVGGKPFSKNYKYLLVVTLNVVLNAAVKDGLLMTNPLKLVDDKPKQEETEREYLTAAELKRVAAAECPNEDVKRAFLFACFTGMRISDLRKLTYADIDADGGRYFVGFRQKKTGGINRLPIPTKAVQYINVALVGKDECVFSIPSKTGVDYSVSKMAINAKLNKHITFHSSRHTCATLTLNGGVDMAVVQDILGHKSIKTTQIYAKVMSKAKEDAADKLDKMVDL